MRAIPVGDRFFDKVSKDASGCWNWTASLRHGYGTIKLNGKCTSAHRVSYELHYGKIPEGLHILHKCNNTRCVNPGHLYAGTHLQNMRDIVKVGGFPDRRCELHPNAKLTDEDVLEIKRLRKQGIFCHVLAKQYGVNRHHIGNIANGKIRG